MHSVIKNILFSSCLFLILGSYTIAQSLSSEDIKKLKKADSYYSAGAYSNAYPLYLSLENIISEDVLLSYKIAVCIIETNSDDYKSLPFLLKALPKKEELKISNWLYYYLGRSYHANYKFEEAINYFKKFLLTKEGKSNDAEVIRRIQISQNAIQLVLDTVSTVIENLGPVINSKYSEYSPVITADESMLVFTSRKPGNIGGLQNDAGKSDENGYYYEDIFISYKDDDDNWMEPIRMPEHINTKGHDASVGLAPGGNELFIYRSNKNENGNIYLSILDGKDWSAPEKVERNINSKYWEGRASISADGTEIYFSSDRPGGYGKSDLYKVKLIAEGIWSEPINLGSEVNTPFEEDAPFIHPNGKTFYFSSKGHNTMGGYDIFRTELENNKWSEVENVGYPINTVDDDINFVLSADGIHGYYASKRAGGFGEQDIYRIIMPESNIRITMVKGVILGGDSLKPVAAKIKVIDKLVGKTVKYIYNPNPETGRYLMIFPPGRNYDMIVDAEGYLPSLINIYVPNQTYFFELFQEIRLQPVKGFGEVLGQEVSVTNIFYDLGQSDSMRNNAAEHKKILEKNVGNDNPNTKDYSPLFELIEKIINMSDTAGLYNFDKELDKIEEKNSDNLLNLVLEVINQSDSIDFSKKVSDAESVAKTFLYGNDTGRMEQMIIDGDTFYVLPSINTGRVSEKENSDSNQDTLPLVENQRILLSVNLTFDVNSANIKSEEISVLTTILNLLEKKPDLYIELYGHTDAKGDEVFNQKLAASRTESVAKYLTGKGVKPNRILKEALGASNPIANNTTEEGRRLNRRVEIFLIEITNKLEK